MTGDRLLDLYQTGNRIDNGCDPWLPLRRSVGLKDPNTLAEAQLGIAWASCPEEMRSPLDNAFRKGVTLCESPIEKFMLPWLLVATARYSSWEPLCLLAGESDQLPPGRLAVVPQLPIGQYRVDFAIAGRRLGPVCFYIVECDGKEFHEADKDAIRDERLLKNPRVLGIKRLPGKDIKNDASGWSLQVARDNLEAWRGRP